MTSRPTPESKEQIRRDLAEQDLRDSKPHPELFDTVRGTIGMWRYKRAGDWDKRVAAAHAALDGIEEQLETYERALRDIVHLPDETQAYSYADACVNIARAALNPASEPKEDA